MECPSKPFNSRSWQLPLLDRVHVLSYQGVKDEGLPNMKSGTWYKVLVENKVTMQTEAKGTRAL